MMRKTPPDAPISPAKRRATAAPEPVTAERGRRATPAAGREAPRRVLEFEDDAADAADAAFAKPAPFGRSQSSPTNPCTPATKRVYQIVQKSTGSIGGNGHGGAIYGETTAASLQRVVDVLKAECGLGRASAFIDVGSGLGKPPLHVAQDPGVAVAFGVEMEHVRWQLGMANQVAVIRESGGGGGGARGGGDDPSARVYFQHCDIREAATFDPFSHVYMFDIGFPPTLFGELAAKFNASACPRWLISYQPPRRIERDYGFKVQMKYKVFTAMHGSSEGHTAYIYQAERAAKALSPPPPPADARSDPLFADGIALLRGAPRLLFEDARARLASALEANARGGERPKRACRLATAA